MPDICLDREDENRKVRKAAKRVRNDDIAALVKFVKKRDPRVIKQQQKVESEKAAKEEQQRIAREQKKLDAQVARENWKAEAEENLAVMEEMDRLAGRVRLADLDDDYDYGGGKKGKKKGKKGKKKSVEEKPQSDKDGETENTDADVDAEGGAEEDVDNQSETGEADDTNGDAQSSYGEKFSESEESSEEPEVWRCECCRKDFKSEGQMENHMKSKKHKEAWKKYEKKLKETQ